MVQVQVLHTFGNRIEGRRVHQGSVIDLPDHRVRALKNATPGRPLVKELTPEQRKYFAEHGRLPDQEPHAKVEPDSQGRRSGPRQAPSTEGSAGIINPRREIKDRQKAPPRVIKKKGTQAKEPAAPRPLARGSRTGQDEPSSSSQAGPAPGVTITRPRGTRSPKQSGSQSTTPTS